MVIFLKIYLIRHIFFSIVDRTIYQYHFFFSSYVHYLNAFYAFCLQKSNQEFDWKYLPICCRRLVWYRSTDGEVCPRTTESVAPTTFARVSVCYPCSNCNTTDFYVSSWTTNFVVPRPPAA